jgi:hypothetical protein
MTGRAGLFGALAPHFEKTPQVGAVNECGPTIVDGRKPPPDPVTDGVLMRLQRPGRLLHRVGPVNLDKPRIDAVARHLSKLKLLAADGDYVDVDPIRA